MEEAYSGGEATSSTLPLQCGPLTDSPPVLLASEEDPSLDSAKYILFLLKTEKKIKNNPRSTIPGRCLKSKKQTPRTPSFLFLETNDIFADNPENKSLLLKFPQSFLKPNETICKYYPPCSSKASNTGKKNSK